MDQRLVTVVADRESDVDIVYLWRLILANRMWIIITTVIAAAASVAYGLLSTPVFRSEVTVTEVHETAMGNMSGLASQLGGLASLAGVNLLGAGGESQESEAVLHSRKLVEEFIRRNDLTSLLLRKSKRPPTLWRAVEVFRDDVLLIRDDKRTGTTTITITWTDPATAARWANSFLALANELVRTRALVDSSRNITYLKDQIQKTNLLEMQKVMYNLIESQTKTLMLANGRIEYAFTVVDPAVPAEIRYSPKRTLIAIFGTAFGAFIGLLLAFSRDRIRSQSLSRG